MEKTIEKVGIPKYYFRDETRNQYNNVPQAIVRELIQNSRDAGAKNMWFEFEDGRYSCRDDGHGMNEADFRKFYLNLGGTLKQTDSIGGFGAAKKLTFAAESWTAIGNGFICHGEGSEFNIDPFVSQTGFIIVGNDPAYTKYQFNNALKEICAYSYLPLTIWVKSGEDFLPMSQGRKLRANQMLWDFGFARLYSPKITEKAGFGETTGYKYIRTKGLLTKSEYVGGDFIYYLEIDEPLKILTENRESIREEYRKKISEEIRAVEKKGQERRTEYKQITLYGVPKQRYRNGSNPITSHPIVVNQNGDFVRSGQQVNYVSEVGHYPTEEPVEEPDNGFVTSIDVNEIASLSEIRTEMGMLNFVHKQQQHWTYPFAIVEDGKKAVQMFTKVGELTDKAKKSLTITLTIGKMLADDLGIPCPIPALLFSDTSNGVNCHSGPYEIIGLDPDIVTGQLDIGSPFGVLELIIHEFAHHWEGNHSQSYESERMRIARKIGLKAEVYLNIIKGLQNA